MQFSGQLMKKKALSSWQRFQYIATVEMRRAHTFIRPIDWIFDHICVASVTVYMSPDDHVMPSKPGWCVIIFPTNNWRGRAIQRWPPRCGVQRQQSPAVRTGCLCPDCWEEKRVLRKQLSILSSPPAHQTGLSWISVQRSPGVPPHRTIFSLKYEKMLLCSVWKESSESSSIPVFPGCEYSSCILGCRQILPCLFVQIGWREAVVGISLLWPIYKPWQVPCFPGKGLKQVLQVMERDWSELEAHDNIHTHTHTEYHWVMSSWDWAEFFRLAGCYPSQRKCQLTWNALLIAGFHLLLVPLSILVYFQSKNPMLSSVLTWAYWQIQVYQVCVCERI